MNEFTKPSDAVASGDIMVLARDDREKELLAGLWNRLRNQGSGWEDVFRTFEAIVRKRME